MKIEEEEMSDEISYDILSKNDDSSVDFKEQDLNISQEVSSKDLFKSSINFIF